MKKYIIVTGGAGFVGSNLIEYFLYKSKYKLISVDNYSTGKIINHINSKRVTYLKGDTKNISQILKKYKNKINCIFHFGEFSRIYQSFKNFNQCYDSNSIGSKEIFKFCLDDKNLSPYAFTKAKNLELLENLKKWFNFKFDVIFFYNVYGPKQIKSGKMATVIGVFENYYEKNKFLPVVKPGTQTRRFTHIQDTIEICYEAWKNKRYLNYSVSNKKSYSIIEVARMFGSKFKFLPKRKGERYASALTSLHNKQKVHKRFGKISLKNYIYNFINNSNA